MSNQNPKHEKQQVSEEKLALAEKIKGSKKRFEHRYRGFESAIIRFFRMLSSWIDKILFNQKYGILVSLVLAILLVSFVNADSASDSNPVVFSKTFTLNVVVNGNTDFYEYSNLPETVEVTATSSSNSDLFGIEPSTGNYYVEADLRNLSEGTSNVTLVAKNFPSQVSTIVSPNIVSVTIAKREVAKFSVSAEFINMNSLDDRYDVGTPIFETSEVNVRASADSLNNISSIKALIDVSGQTEEFTQEATLVAYDQEGNKMSNVLIIPETVNVTVPITSINKDVPVSVKVNGTIPNGKAIESITLDNNTVRIYGSQNVLDGITSIQKTLEASEITGDINGKIYLLDKPSGVRYMTPDKINVSITLGDEVSKTITGVTINTKNNTKGLKIEILNPEDAYTDVVVYGTESNIQGVSLESFQNSTYEVYIDMTDVEVGQTELELKIVSSDPRIRFELLKTKISVNIVE